jgi:hypothetical protein
MFGESFICQFPFTSGAASKIRPALVLFDLVQDAINLPGYGCPPHRRLGCHAQGLANGRSAEALSGSPQE